MACGKGMHIFLEWSRALCKFDWRAHFDDWPIERSELYVELGVYLTCHCACSFYRRVQRCLDDLPPVSYTHLTLPTILLV
eukprot:2579893-Pyramimonas_sp.AAC.1